MTPERLEYLTELVHAAYGRFDFDYKFWGIENYVDKEFLKNLKQNRLKQLTQLLNSKDNYDRMKAARAVDLSLELQEILARDKDCDVRCHLANNQSLVNVKIQEMLAIDQSTSVRYYLARNPSCTDRKIWELLRNDESESENVRRAIDRRMNEEKDKIKKEFKEKINK